MKKTIDRSMQRVKKSGLVVLCAVTLAACGRRLPELHGTVMDVKAPALNLNDASGHAFTPDRLRGKVTVVFFGYTHCPDVCPTTLSRLAQVVKGQAENDAARIQVVFISVDPDRDTPAVSARYVHLFDPSFISLSGTGEQLEETEKRYHVWAQKLPPKRGKNDYEVAHSSAVFVIDQTGNLVEILPWDASAATFTSDIMALIRS